MYVTFKVDWDGESQKVIRLDYPAGYEWEEFFTAMERTGELASSVEHGVYIILNMLQLEKPPGGLLMNFPKIARLRPDNELAAIVVGADGFLEQMGQIFSRVYGHFHFVKTVDGAYAHITKLQESEGKKG